MVQTFAIHILFGVSLPNTRVTYGEFAVPMYVCMYVFMYVCSDTSSTCSPRMRKYSDGEDRHGAVIVQYGTIIGTRCNRIPVSTSVE